MFLLHLRKIQPSQLYISSVKLAKVMEFFDRVPIEQIEPVPVKELDGEIISTDGHTRLFAWFLRGRMQVPVEWEDEDLSWEAYRICVQWCKDEGITWIGDLKDRVVGEEDYQRLWYDRCSIMQRELGIE